MKVTREKLFVINGAFDRLSKERANTFFRHTLSKNKQLIENELKAVEAARNKPNEKYSEYEKKRMAACEALCLRDDEGKPCIVDAGTSAARYDFTIEAREEVNEQIEELKIEYKSAIDDFEETVKEFNELLQGEVEVEFKKFKLNQLPAEMSGEDMDIIFDLVEEE